MRTKTLIMTAALSAAGIATSMAQVYSVNAVGYVNWTLKPGFNLIANPLIAADNHIPALFAGVPNLTQVYAFDGANFTTYQYLTAGGGRWLGGTAGVTDAAHTEVKPGGGVFVRNPTAADVNITFVGEVDQGTALSNPIPLGLSIKSSRVPQQGTATALSFPAANLDQIYKFNPVTQQYKTFQFVSAGGGRWLPAFDAAGADDIKVGEAIFVRKAVAGDWTRSFTVN